MLIVETIRKMRCAYQRDGKSIRQIAREFHLARNTVKKVLRGQATEFLYAHTAMSLPWCTELGLSNLTKRYVA